MKKAVLFLFVLFVFSKNYGQVKTYFSSGMDLMLTYSSFNDTLFTTQDPRLTWWFNFAEYYQLHFSNYFGMYIGMGIRNVGLIARYTDTTFTKRKFRAYTVHVPLGIKIGDLESKNPFYITLGGDLDIPFHYKEKWFNGSNRTNKISEWFSNRVELIMPSAFVGFTVKRYTIRIHYYPLNFLNQDFSYTSQGKTIRPYKHVDRSNLISVEIGVALNRLKEKKN